MKEKVSGGCDTFEVHCDTFVVHCDTFVVHCDTFEVHCDTFGVHCDTFEVHCDTFEVHLTPLRCTVTPLRCTVTPLRCTVSHLWCTGVSFTAQPKKSYFHRPCKFAKFSAKKILVQTSDFTFILCFTFFSILNVLVLYNQQQRGNDIPKHKSLH